MSATKLYDIYRPINLSKMIGGVHLFNGKFSCWSELPVSARV